MQSGLLSLPRCRERPATTEHPPKPVDNKYACVLFHICCINSLCSNIFFSGSNMYRTNAPEIQPLGLGFLLLRHQYYLSLCCCRENPAAMIHPQTPPTCIYRIKFSFQHVFIYIYIGRLGFQDVADRYSCDLVTRAWAKHICKPVSYTHLTLPTIYSV